ncbi:alpha/beta hydrolase [Paenarthrobacter ilicis]|uniref:Enterochelin esterase-like enzyme n=2 Tax=Actinomycetes TaxID=1760 RepID=A0ABX0TBF8_9MICC|nr:alpha/beta hydrolase-fold protein [Paenarthrobacter ilicis]MBM7793668.1 enterochelin esterase-like enzyme [Paenarthrobacter ilicis]NII99847.1 enterochelin esterase-like enzyme [Paenarthrobacter ilicis]
MDFLSDVSLVDGPVMWASIALGSAGAAYLLWKRRRTWAVVVVACLVASAGLVALVHWILIDLAATFSENLPFETLMWSGVAVASLLICIMRMRRSSWAGRILSVLSMLLVVVLCLVQVNLYFGLNKSVADLLGTSVARIPVLEPALTRAQSPQSSPSLSGWKAPDSMPGGGILRKSNIPGTASGFAARDAYIYLPPAYQTTPRPELPVLVLFAGQPGGPTDWLSGGQLRSVMDRFASEHQGLAPVTVIVDPNGSANANTMCMDSRIAQVDTYLSQDVPAWISQTLSVNRDHKQWAVGGFSFGGTCALQMGTLHPDLFPSILPFAAEREPALAKDRNKTIADSFDGDVEAFESKTPLVLMQQRNYSGSGVYLVSGEADHEFTGYMNELAAAAKAAGFETQEHPIPGAGHSWEAVIQGMPGGLGFLAQRWGLPS